MPSPFTIWSYKIKKKEKEAVTGAHSFLNVLELCGWILNLYFVQGDMITFEPKEKLEPKFVSRISDSLNPDGFEVSYQEPEGSPVILKIIKQQ
jgi:hypothetical protein